MDTLLSRNVFQTYQVNGQRITINHLIKAEDEGYEVFIGNLPRNMYENELLPLFMSVGHLCEVRVMMNFSGHNRGFAFARFFNKESAELAVKFLDKFEIRDGRRIAVTLSKNKKKLFIARLPNHMKDELVSELVRLATKNVVKVDVRHCVKNGTGRLHCFVDYATHMDACKARRELVSNGKKIFHSEILVDWALLDEKEVEAHRKRLRRNAVLTKSIHKGNDTEPINSSVLDHDGEMQKSKFGDQKLPTESRAGPTVVINSNLSDRAFSPVIGIVGESKKDILYDGPRVCNRNHQISQLFKPLQIQNIQQIAILQGECQLCGPNCRSNKKYLNTLKFGNRAQCR